MNCKQAQKLIKQFMNDDLETEDLRDFIEHIDSCGECHEELVIEFLVTEGVKRLESGNVFDLNKELGLRIEESNKDLKVREGMQWFYYVILGLIVIAIATIIMILVFL